jgi:anti-sigma factor RsiW
MTSSASSAARLPAAIARAAVVTPSVREARVRDRHSAPETSGRLEIVAVEQVAPGRHAEAEWSREMFEASRDEDAFEWLGFTA